MRSFDPVCVNSTINLSKSWLVDTVQGYAAVELSCVNGVCSSTYSPLIVPMCMISSMVMFSPGRLRVNLVSSLKYLSCRIVRKFASWLFLITSSVLGSAVILSINLCSSSVSGCGAASSRMSRSAAYIKALIIKSWYFFSTAIFSLFHCSHTMS